MASEKKTWLRWLIAAAKLIVFVLLCWFIYDQISTANESLSQRESHIHVEWLVVSGLLYLLGLLPQGAFWYYVLRRADQDVTVGESIRASYISQLGKYVPGKWMVILLRRTLLHSPVENTVVVASVFFEAFTSLAVGGAISALLMLIWHPNQVGLIGIAVFATLLLGVPTIPFVFEWLLRVLRVGRLNPTVGKKLTRIGAKAIIVGWLAIGAGWVVQGMSLWATLRSLDAVTGSPLEDLSLHTTAVSLGVVAGFISQLPGGLGVREWVSAELMEPEYGPAVSFISAVVFRLVMIVSELSISAILYLAGWRQLKASRAAVAAADARAGAKA